MSIRTLLSLCLMASAGAAHAAPAPIAATCNPDKAGLNPEFVIRLEKTGTLVVEQTESYRPGETQINRFKIVGNTSDPKEYNGALTAVLAARSSEGKYLVLTLATEAASGKPLPGYQRTETSSGRLQCTAGPAFELLTKNIRKARALSRQEYFNAQDTVLAATCSLRGQPGTQTHEIRAMHDSFGDIDLQVNDLKERFSRSRYNRIEIGANGVYVFKNNKTDIIQYQGDVLARAYVNPKLTRDSLGRKFHLVSFVPDLLKPEKGIIELECAEAQAWSSIGTYLDEVKQMPTALPRVPGTLAQINPKLCGPQGNKESSKLNQMWSSLIMDLPLENGMDITWVGQGMSDDGKRCPIFKVGVSNQATLEFVRARVGDSLAGIEVNYEAASGGASAL